MGQPSTELAPRFGVRGERLAAISAAMDDLAQDCAERFNTRRSAVLCALAGVTAAHLAAVSREATATFCDALATAIRNAPNGGELDRRRIDRAAIALFEAEAQAA